MSIKSSDVENSAEDQEDFSQFVTFCYNSVWGGSPSPLVIMTGGCRTGVRMSADIDVMLPEYNVIALPLEGDATETSFIEETFRSDTTLYIYTTDDVHSGFARLMMRDGQDFSRFDLKRKVSLDDGLSFLSEGPALTLNESSTSSNELLSSIIQHEIVRTALRTFSGGIDLVACVHCPVWPPVAAEWITRPRCYSIPSRSLIERCIQHGCHFVAKSHSTSSAPDIEFRYSFSLAEDVLVSGWNRKQVCVYNNLKNVKTYANKQFAGSNAVLCSYHMKTLMFWAMEENSPIFWGESPIASTGHLVTKLVKMLENQSCPHYFIKENNLFEKISNDARGKLLYILVNISRNYDLLDSEPLISGLGNMDAPLSFAISLRSMAYLSLQKENVLLELRDLYEALRAQLELQSMTVNRHEALKLVENAFRRAIDYDKRTVTLYYERGILSFEAERSSSVTASIEQLHPTKWRRSSSCLVEHSNGYKVGTSSASANNQNKTAPLTQTRSAADQSSKAPYFSLTFEQFMNFISVTGYVKFTEHVQTRISGNCSAVYFANFCFLVRHEYKRAIALCEDVIKNDDPTYVIHGLQPSIYVEWASLFDEDIQSLMGLVAVYDALYRRATGQELSREPSFILLHYLTFAQYIRIRCFQSLMSQDVDINAKQSFKRCALEAVNNFKVYPSRGPNRRARHFAHQLLYWSVIKRCLPL